MSYRSRLYHHRNAQAPEGGKKKPFFSSRHGAGAADDKKKFFHSDDGGAPQIQRLATSELDEGIGTNEERMARNKGDKLRQGNERGGVIQPAPAIGHAAPATHDREITPQQVHEAKLYNNERYGKDSIRLIQGVVGAGISGVMDDDTVRRIAQFQAKYNRNADGMAGAETFELLTDALNVKSGSQDRILTSFRIDWDGQTDQSFTNVSQDHVNIWKGLKVDILFDPHGDCSQYEYRQWIGGEAFRETIDHRRRRIDNLNAQFLIPRRPAKGRPVRGRGLPGLGNWREDGFTKFVNQARYGHRDLENDHRLKNKYSNPDGSEDRLSGCAFSSEDKPGLYNAPGISGDIFRFNIRFLGEILKDGKPIEQKYWSFRENIVIP